MTTTPVALAAATAAAGAVPSTGTLTATGDTPWNPTDFGTAVVTEIVGTPGAHIGVAIGADLTNALANSPIGALDPADALQPALDAAAANLGVTVRAAKTVELADIADIFATGLTGIPLVEADRVHAVVLLSSDLAPAAAQNGPARGIEMLHGVVLDVTVEIGRTRMTVKDLLALSPGNVLELDRAAGSPADLLVNGRLIARGEVVVVDEDFGLRVTEVVATDPIA